MGPADTHVREYLCNHMNIITQLDVSELEHLITEIAWVQSQGGRMFFLGVGGSAANASHAVNDFRKLCGIECYAPTDNIAELTARTNDEGWEGVFESWLRGSRLRANDTVFVLSVGGGNIEKNISVNIVRALVYARQRGAMILGIVGRDGGETKQFADACVVIPTIDPAMVTPHTESFQSVLLHLIVTHPWLATKSAKWESVTEPSHD